MLRESPITRFPPSPQTEIAVDEALPAPANPDKGSSTLGEVPADRLSTLPTVVYRELREQDRRALLALHHQCFPVKYENQFYDKAVRGALFSCAAFIWEGGGGEGGGEGGPQQAAAHRKQIDSPRPDLGGGVGNGAAEKAGGANLNGGGGGEPGGGAEELAAVIISQISPQGEYEDKILSDGNPNHKVAYICTLGVWPKFRQHRLAGELLSALLRRVESEAEIKAVSLHVLTTNQVAVHFYEKNGFTRLRLLKDFYTIEGVQCDAFLYVRYLHDGRPPQDILAFLAAALHRPVRAAASAVCSQLSAMLRRFVAWGAGNKRHYI